MKAKDSIDEKGQTKANPPDAGEDQVFARPFERSFSKRSAVTRVLRINSAACSSARWTSATSGRRIWLVHAAAAWKISRRSSTAGRD